MSSDSSSDAESNRSGTPAPIVNNHKSRSGSPVSNRSHSGSRSRSPSAGSGSQASNHSRKSRSRSVGSHSGASNRSASGGSQRSGSRGSKRSGSGDSKRSGSGGSRRSRSGGSKRSESGGSKRSGSGGSRRSGSGGSKRSGSGGSRRSGSAASRQSGSPVSKRSGSAISRRSGSAASRRSASGSSKRSGSPASNRSGSPTSKKSRSRSGSAASNRSRSKSAASNRSRSRSRSKTPGSNRSGSGSRRSRSGSSNRSRSAASNKSRSRSRSGSISQNLQIDEPRSPGDKRKGSEEKQITSQKKSRVIDSDSEDDDNGDKGVSAAAIFGDDADDISSEEEKEKAGSEKEEQRQRGSDDDIERVGDGLGGSDEEIEQRNAIEDDEDKENEPEVIPETRIDVEIPKISCNLGKDINFVKLPNFLSVETRPFDPETYEDEIDEEETLDEEGRARLKLKVENTIRWRDVMDDEGNVKKESNARIIKWSDGSYSLHLGSEIFDVYRQPLQGDHNHLFIRQGTGLQGQAVFRTKLSFRPHSTESFTHRKMTLSLADRSQKTSGIKILSQVGVDPDHDKAMRIKKEEEKLRQSARPTKTRSKKGEGGSRSHSISNVYREEEGSDEDGAISLNAIKNKYKGGASAVAKGGAIYSSDEEGSDIENRRSRKQDKTKALKDSDTSEESDDE